MKKPEIRFIPYEGFAVRKSNGEYLDDDVTAEAYEEMIDALIESTKLLEHLKSIETEPELIHEIEQQISMNKYSALRKAGCQ